MGQQAQPDVTDRHAGQHPVDRRVQSQDRIGAADVNLAPLEGSEGGVVAVSHRCVLDDLVGGGVDHRDRLADLVGDVQPGAGGVDGDAGRLFPDRDGLQHLPGGEVDDGDQVCGGVGQIQPGSVGVEHH